MEKFPERSFILIGDSGEKDPEVYHRIQTLFPRQVQEIRIRDVVNARELQPERLAGTIIIPA
jgi:phosphatidate phosphatase APP1